MLSYLASGSLIKKNTKERIWFSDYIAHVKNKVRILKESFTVTNNVNISKQRYGILSGITSVL